jgi:hypothetical protein
MAKGRVSKETSLDLITNKIEALMLKITTPQKRMNPIIPVSDRAPKYSLCAFPRLPKLVDMIVLFSGS